MRRTRAGRCSSTWWPVSVSLSPTGGGATRTVVVSGLSVVDLCLLGVVTAMGLADEGCSVPLGAVVAVLLCGFLAAVGMCAWLFATRPPRPTAPVPAPPTRAALG